ncbi:P-loop containing nucleoside triphosphate hydrolase protein [Mycena olivaceomarginata]|nr:P-loop containing nucleoside triphosphate hydrolase protein [Mycena olivaceomarginata]
MELFYPSETPANYRELEALAEYGASPSFSALSAARATGSLEPPDILRTGTLLTAFVALLLRILANRKAPICISRKVDILAAWKAFFGVIYIASAVAMLVAGRKGPSEWILVLGMGVVTAITFTVASISEHYHSIAPSTLTCIYAVIGSAVYAYPLRGVRALSAKSKRQLLIPTEPPPAYESTLSFLVRPFFPHIIPILYAGSRRRITLPELRDIPLHLRSDPATEKLLAALAVEDKTDSWYLVKSTFRAFSPHFLSPVLPRLLALAGTFAQVTLVEQMLLYVSDKSIPKERGTRLIAAYFGVYGNHLHLWLTVLTTSKYRKVNAFIVLYRSALTGCLYAKTLRLTSMAAREVGQGAATTYMSVDVEKVTGGFQTLQELWAAVVTIVIACTMLLVEGGLLCFSIFVLVPLSPSGSISRFVGAAQAEWLKALDVWIKLITSVLGQLLPIKLGAYEAALEAKISALRKLETDAFRTFLYYITFASTLSNIGPSASFLVTLAAYTIMRAKGWGDLPPLDVSRLFTLFTIVSLLNGPLNTIGQSLPGLFASFASIGRIQSFLQLPEKAESDSGNVGTDLGDVDADGLKESGVEVSLTGCTFAWDDKTYVLRDITLQLAPRELHMVVGSVASGKSSLLMSILQETTLVEGTVRVKAPRIALATQTSFIYPGTLRANILLHRTYDEVFYNQVIYACGLRQDIEALPRRDLTKVGDKGSTLSGGQRQRLVCNCSRVYAQADLILLDDVFSALDGETEAHVMRGLPWPKYLQSLFGQDGLLKGKTTVLVTHGVHHLPSADKVIVMDSGTITHFGSFEEVRDAGATFALVSTAGEADAGQAAKQSSTAAAVEDYDEEDEEQDWANEASRKGAYAFYIQCTGVVRACGMFALIVIWSGVGISTTAYMSMLASAPRSRLWLWVAGYGAFVAINLLLMAVSLIYFAYTLSTFTAPHIHRVELAGVMHSPISWITKTPVGRILNRFSHDIHAADFEFPFDFLNFATNLLSMSGTFAFITIAAPLLAFALPFLSVFATYFLKFYLATSKVYLSSSRVLSLTLEAESKSPLYTLFGTTISGLVTVRAFRAQTFFRSQNAAFVNESQGALHHRVGGQLFLRVFLLWFQAILGCSVAVLTVRFRDTTSAAFLGIALSRLVPFIVDLFLLVSLGASMAHLLNSYASMENGTVSIDRIEEFAKLPEEEKTTIQEDVTTDTRLNWPSAASLAFSEFSMKYGENLPLALKNLSFEVPGGIKIGICGRTGSGKSSTVLALFRGIDQHFVTGKISVDGVDISTLSLKHLRESMSIVTQDPFLWHGSIRENLDITNACTDSEIWQTLKLVEMYDAVAALDDKLDHLVVDEESFSKGQRQLLCLARALLRKKKIIVLDESTSSMDHITDEKIRKVVETHMQGLTVLAIAHRISTIVNYDKILVLDSGSVAEFDAPGILLSNPESRFARLAATQGIYHPDTVPNGAAVQQLGDGTVMVVTEDLIDV